MDYGLRITDYHDPDIDILNMSRCSAVVHGSCSLRLASTPVIAMPYGRYGGSGSSGGTTLEGSADVEMRGLCQYQYEMVTKLL